MTDDGRYILKDEYHHHERRLREMKDETARAEYGDAVTRARGEPSNANRRRHFHRSVSSFLHFLY